MAVVVVPVLVELVATVSEGPASMVAAVFSL